MKHGLLVMFIILAHVAAGCSAGMGSTGQATPPPGKPAVSLTTETARQAEWDKTVAVAKQEEKVVVYNTYGPGELTALSNGLHQAYGITIESISGRGAELREKLFRERRAGLYLVDFFMMGASGMILDLKPVGALDPIKPQLVLPEATNLRDWYGGNHLYLDKERTYVLGFTYIAQPPLVVNRELVKPEEIKSYQDLLQTRWTGKLVLNDPTTTGGGQMWLQMVAKALGLDYIRSLANQELMVSRDLRQQTEWVARGKYLILLGPHTGAVSEFMHAGAPLKYVTLPEASYAGTSIGNLALINRPAHPNAARVFINWLLSKEGQTLFSKSFLIQSARLDIPTNHLDPLIVLQPGMVYLNSSDEEIALERDAVIGEASKILGLAVK